MELLPADYGLIGLTLALAITGLFRGFSGSLAFVAGAVAAVFAGYFGWEFSTEVSSAAWIRGLVTLGVSLLAFGIARVIVRKLVHGLLAQPGDAIFGFLLGIVAGAMVAVGWAAWGEYLEYSNIIRGISAHVG